MRKLISGVAAVVTLTAGLATGGTAGAVAPYPHSVPTSTKIKAPDAIERGERLRFRVNVTTQGNADPKGRVLVVVKKLNGTFKWKDTAYFQGLNLRFVSPELERRGKYLIKARFDAKAESVWKDSDQLVAFKVTRRG